MITANATTRLIKFCSCGIVVLSILVVGEVSGLGKRKVEALDLLNLQILPADTKVIRLRIQGLRKPESHDQSKRSNVLGWRDLLDIAITGDPETQTIVDIIEQQLGKH